MANPNVGVMTISCFVITSVLLLESEIVHIYSVHILAVCRNYIFLFPGGSGIARLPGLVILST